MVTVVVPLLLEWTDEAHAVLGDLGYEGEQAALTIPVKKTTDAPLTDVTNAPSTCCTRSPGRWPSAATRCLPKDR
jgi:hypothetical protein